MSTDKHKVIILGDVDYEAGNQVRQMLSGDGSIGHAEVMSTVRRSARDPQIPVIFFHRQGWEQAFDPDAMLGGDLAAVPQSAPPPSSLIQQADKQKSGGCFITMACCGSPADPLVRDLRRFRDEVLVARAPGRALAAAYARFSPPVADWIGGRA